ncbi:MAG: HAMP domain-containing sensor histidine kinase [Myxococcota bacterium]
MLDAADAPNAVGRDAALSAAHARVRALEEEAERAGSARASANAILEIGRALAAQREAADRKPGDLAVGGVFARFDAAVAAVRAENRGISIELGTHWTHIGVLAALAVFMAALNSLLLWVVFRRREHERHLRLDLERANAAKDLFLAVLSHDIRTPMTAILGSAELLERPDGAARAPRHAALVRTAGGTLIRLIDDVLALSRSESGALHFEAAPVDLAALLRDAASLFQPACEARGVDLEVEVAEGLPEKVMGDAARLRQIVNNLLANATKFTESGRITVRLERGVAGALLLSVRDTGPGIDAHLLERIFEPFDQGGAEVGRRHGGSGLGLAIVGSLVRAMGGSVGVQSVLGQGTTFTCALPLPPVEIARAPDDSAARS